MFYKILRAILRPILFLLYRPKVVWSKQFSNDRGSYSLF